MSEPFRSFVIFAGMRTGSNLLESTLNAIRRVTCFGEAFNPYMMGWPDKSELKGITMEAREADPLRLLDAIFSAPNLNGFRYFHDHDPRVLAPILADRRCAKIVLTRNPLDSYVSTRLAWETNQWKLNETETPIPARITFDEAEFRETLEANMAFLGHVQHALQTSGQAAFWLNYDDLRDPKVLTGLLHWLGRTDLEEVLPASDQVPQNPREMAEKVGNMAEMEAGLARIDPFQMHRLPNFEPRRGPAVPGFLTAEAGRGLVFMPVQGGPTVTIAAWLRSLGKVQGELTQNGMRQWKRARPGHRSFTVLRHPLHRAHDAFRAMLAGNAAQRRLLAEVHRVPVPLDDPDSVAEDPGVFAAFLDFLRRNLNAQTTQPTHSGWASQSEVVAGFARFAPPDALLREDRLEEEMAALAAAVGITAAPPQREAAPAFLDDPALRRAARATYQRDYVTFGFED